MTTLTLGLAQKIAFPLLDSNGLPVAGLGITFTLSVSKNGGAFAASTGTKAEIGSGWYSYELTASETDTAGPLAVKVTGAGAVQQNLNYQVTGGGWQAAGGTNILTAEEASTVLRCELDDANMLMLLPGIDNYIEMATGRDWTADSTIYPEAKSAARILLVRWHEDPGGMVSTMGPALTACLVQLEALALDLESSGVPDEALALVKTNILGEMAIDASLVLVFNHEMTAGSINDVTLETAAGALISTTNTLDATGKIMTVNPDASLAADTQYNIVLDHPADVYGQTLDSEVSFSTEAA